MTTGPGSARVPRPGRVCRTPTWAVTLAEHFLIHGYTVTGIDLSEPMLAIARAQGLMPISGKRAPPCAAAVRAVAQEPKLARIRRCEGPVLQIHGAGDGRSGTIKTVDVSPDIERRPGQPRSEQDAAYLERFDARMRVPIIVSAILPLIIVPESNSWVGVVVGIVTWLVFLLDYVVHVRRIYRYRRTGYGRFDLFVVIATAPWFLIPGTQAGQFVVLLRLARIARLLMASRGAHRLFDRLGRVIAVAVGVVVIASLVAYHAEHPVNPEFATVGDALWWGIVTITTVGYGDIVPKTTTGRWAAVVIMVTGIAVLGVLAGALSSFFRVGENGNHDGPPADQPAETAASPNETALTALTAEVSALRLQVEFLTRRLTGTLPDQAPGEPPPGQDPASTPGA